MDITVKTVKYAYSASKILKNCFGDMFIIRKVLYCKSIGYVQMHLDTIHINPYV